MPNGNAQDEKERNNSDKKPIEWKGWIPFFLLIILAGGLLFGLAAMAVALNQTNKDSLTFFVTAGINVLIFIAIVIQAYIYKGQWQVMEQAATQTDNMFYAANRAYIGIAGIGVYSTNTDEIGFPADGQFTVRVEVVNKGRTPALHLGNASRGTFIGRNAPNTEWTFPDFSKVPVGRRVAQILPDQSSPIYGDPMEIEPDIAYAIRRGEIIFTVSTLIEFNCLGIKNEELVIHHVWDHRKNHFAESAVWPPDIRFADVGLPTPKNPNPDRPTNGE